MLGSWSRGTITGEFDLARLEDYLNSADLPASEIGALGACLEEMVHAGLDRLPLPARGETLARWRALATVAAHDLGLVKLFEGHTDALAILAELDVVLGDEWVPPGSTWGMWAAEPPQARVTMTRLPGAAVELNGRKAWCSGASVVSHALLTVWENNNEQCLAQSRSISRGYASRQRVGGWSEWGRPTASKWFSSAPRRSP